MSRLTRSVRGLLSSSRSSAAWVSPPEPDFCAWKEGRGGGLGDESAWPWRQLPAAGQINTAAEVFPLGPLNRRCAHDKGCTTATTISSGHRGRPDGAQGNVHRLQWTPA